MSVSMTVLPKGLSCQVSIFFLCVFAGSISPVTGPRRGWNIGLWDIWEPFDPEDLCAQVLCQHCPWGLWVTGVHTVLPSRSPAPALWELTLGESSVSGTGTENPHWL